MASIIPLFRMLDSNMYIITMQTPYSFFYKKDGEIVDLECSATSSSYKSFTIKDTKKGLRADDYKLSLKKSINMINCNNLYSLNGVACRDSKLGFALIWKSHDSKLRGAKGFGIIRNTHEEQTLEISYVFPEGTFRGCVEFSIVVYLKSLGTERRPFICDLPGTILGEISNNSFFFDGNGSIFPVITVEEPSNPLLWNVDCSWVDPEEDSFSDCVLIKINKSHKDYEKVLYGSSKFDKNLFVEIIAAALTIIISSLREKHPSIWDLLTTSEYNPSNGSVCQVVKYLIDTCEMDFSDANRTSVSFRQFLLKRVRQ